MKRFTMTLITLSLAALLLGACVLVPAAPPTPIASPVVAPAATGASAPAADWQTYTNAEVGFSIKMPPIWSQQTLPDQNNGAIHGQAFTGPEGGVEVYWGVGFGGACPSGTEPVQLAQGELPACHTTNSDGTETWSQIGYQVEGGNSFSVRAYTSDAEPSSHDLVLQVLAMLTFMPPTQAQAGATIANPASENCVKQGGAVSIVARGDGGKYGICTFADNGQCEEWALLRGECPAGGVKVTGYVTPAATFCAITGGTYAVTSNSGQPDEQGTCTLPGGVQCDATAYYDGKCDASTGKMPYTSGLALVPPAAEVCNGMAQALAEALLRANTQHANVEVTQSDQPVPMTDVATGAEGTGCRATATATGEQFASPDAVMQRISAVLTGGGWVDERQQTSSDGPTGKGWGFRSGDLVTYASVIWLPADSANCPQDQPIPECKVTPAQQLYTVTLDTGQEIEQAPLTGAAVAPVPAGNPATQNCINQGGTPKTDSGRAAGSTACATSAITTCASNGR